MMHLINETLLKPLKRHTALILAILGFFLVLAGVLTESNSWYSNFLLHLGSASLGAGVFAAILKSAQFTELFQKHITTVFYDPAQIDKQTTIDRWEVMTDSLLKDIIPDNFAVASKILKEHFLDADLHFHFEEFNVTHDILVIKENKIATITNTATAKMIIPPGIDNPILEQDFKLDSGSIESTELFLNGKKQDFDQLIDQEKSTENHKYIRIELSPFYTKGCPNAERVINLERTIKFTQDLINEPFIYVSIQRFTKGATVKAKIAYIENQPSSSYTINLVKTGLDNWQNSSDDNDTKGYQRWELADKEFLLLPGQGYILTFTQT